MKPEDSLPHLQVPANCPYPEPDRTSPYPPHPSFLRSILILSSHLRLGLPSDLLPSGFLTTTLYTPLLPSIRATCPAHLILLDWITRTILGEQYKSFLGSTQPLKMSTSDFFWGRGGWCVRLTTYHPCSAERQENPWS